MKTGNIPEHAVAPGFTPVSPVVTKILNLAAVRSLVDKPNYDTKSLQTSRVHSRISALRHHKEV
jgi:hypothetical protein